MSSGTPYDVPSPRARGEGGRRPEEGRSSARIVAACPSSGATRHLLPAMRGEGTHVFARPSRTALGRSSAREAVPRKRASSHPLCGEKETHIDVARATLIAKSAAFNMVQPG